MKRKIFIKGICKKKINNNAGFSILEVVIATAISSMIFLSIALTVSSTLRTYENLSTTSTAIDLTNITTDAIVGELALAKDIAFYGIGENEAEDAPDIAHMSYTYGGYQKYFPTVVNGKAGAGALYSNLIENESALKLIIIGKPYVYGAVFDDTLYGDLDVIICIEMDKARLERNVLVINTFYFREAYYDEVINYIDNDEATTALNTNVSLLDYIINGGYKDHLLRVFDGASLAKNHPYRNLFEKANSAVIYFSRKPACLYNQIR